jgi:general secretion pathway protein M
MKKFKFDIIVDWFSKLSASDKRALIILVAFLFCAFMYYVTDLSFNYRKTQISKLEENRSLILLLNTLAQKLHTSKSQVKYQALDQPLLTLVSSTAKDNQIVFKRFQPDGDNVLKLWLEHVSFNSLLLWLHGLDKKNGISVQEISVEQAKEEGYVDVRLILKR